MDFANKGSTLVAIAALSCGVANAVEIDTGNSDLTLHWDTTVKYTLTDRLKNPDRNIVNKFPNNNDGDQNFRRGIVSRRFDLFTEADISYLDRFGARVSGAAWYDAVYYSHTTANTTPVFPNRTDPSQFSPGTKRVMGRDSELLDGFVYGNFRLGDFPFSLRLGRHSLIWGESLFFGSNGIAGLQAPVDVIKLSSVPNSLFKETVLPTRKLSATVQLTSDVSMSGYVDYEWRATRLLPAGSFLSTNDFIGPGGENVLGNGHLIPQGTDITPSNRGQGGLSLRWRLGETDLGAYWVRSDAMTPSSAVIRLGPGANFSRYYQEGIKTFGLSFAKSIGDWSLSGETSYRMNSPLAFATPTIVPPHAVFDNKSNTPYPVGDSVHAQFGLVKSFGQTFLSSESTLLGEIAWNDRTKFSHGEQYADPTAKQSSFAYRLVYAATYRQVFPGLDLMPSVGGGVTHGTSSAVGNPFNLNKAGDVNTGLTATFRDRVTANMNYVHFIGPDSLQLQKDRDYINMSVRTTF